LHLSSVDLSPDDHLGFERGFQHDAARSGGATVGEHELGAISLPYRRVRAASQFDQSFVGIRDEAWFRHTLAV